MKILIVGDTHGDLSFWRNKVIPFTTRNELSYILQLGDFGVWTHTREGRAYIHRLNVALDDADTDLWFIDGNHECFEDLYTIYRGNKGQPKPVPMHTRITWLPRGSWIDFNGRNGPTRFLACGGAHSIDKAYRIPGKSWWPEETITPQDVKRCQSVGKADVLLSHDCPEGVRPAGEHAEIKEMDPQTAINRERLTQVMRNARVKLVLHGHWHSFHDDTTLDGVRVVGLDCNTNPDWYQALAILDTDDNSLTFPRKEKE